MSKQFSQIIVPFKRVTGEPIELDYKFSTEDELKQWASENAAILHAGLLKIVENTDSKNLSFYTFREIPNSSSSVIDVKNFELVKLFDIGELDGAQEDIQDLKDQIIAIWGVEDPANINENYNSIKKLAETVDAINGKIGKLRTLHQTDKALAGYAGDDIIEYLQTLKYGSITALSKALNSFLNTSSAVGSDIITWEDLRNFLTGYKNDTTLKDIINQVTGGVFTFVDTDTVSTDVRELKTGTEVRLNVKLGTGVDDSDLNIRNDNQIIVKNGGIFHNLQIHDTGDALRFKVNGSIIHIFEYAKLISSAISIEDITYDPSTEQLIIKVKTSSGIKEYKVPMSLILRNWDVSNTKGSGVILTLTRATADEGDKLSARAEISIEEGNAVQLKSDGLYASNDSNDIHYGNVSVAHQLDVLKLAIDANAGDVDKKIEEVQQLVADTKTDLQNELAANITAVNGSISDLEEKLTKADADNLASLDNKINITKKELEQTIQANKEEGDQAHVNLNEKIDATNKAIADLSADLQNKITEEAGRIEGLINDTNAAYQEADTQLSGKIDELKAYVDEATATLRREMSDMKQELLDAINSAIASNTEAHVQEYHTIIEATENEEGGN